MFRVTSVQYLAIVRRLSLSADSAANSTVAEFKKIYPRILRSAASG
jgi:hypothetical protein